MLIEAVRVRESLRSYMGEFIIDGKHECFFIENITRAISTGEYRVKTDWSPNKRMYVPELQDVPGRSQIQIHIANYPEELQGCIGVGLSRSYDWVGQSRLAFERIAAKVKDAENRGEEVTIIVLFNGTSKEN